MFYKKYYFFFCVLVILYRNTSFIHSFIHSFRPVTKIIRFPVKDENMEIFTEDNVKLDVEFIPIQEKVQVIPGRKSSAKYDVIFVASEIPALGYKTYFVQQMMSQNYYDQILEPIEIPIDEVELIAQPADYPGVIM